MASPHTVAVVLNPKAHNADQIDAGGIQRRLEQSGYVPEVVVPDSLEASLAAIQATVERNDERVFVAGGDGTLRIAAKILAGTQTALAPIPAGTANVLAKELGIQKGWNEAIDEHLTGQVREMDVGWAGDEPFLLMASIGWDADVAAHVNLAIKDRVGAAAYALSAVKRLRGLSVPKSVRGSIDHREADGAFSLLVLGNTRNYGGIVEFTPDAIADDGVFDLCGVAPDSLWREVQFAGRLLFNRLKEGEWVRRRQASDVHIETPDVPVQVDGDVIGTTPMHFTIAHQALKVSIPPGDLPPIFSQPATG